MDTFSKGADFSGAVSEMLRFLTSLTAPMLLLVGAAASLYCIVLGVQYARAEGPEDREKAKKRIVTMLMGYFLIFILILLMQISMPIFVAWVQRYSSVINGTVYD
ncbi:MAG: hypothetical protein IJU50_02655 [Lachnospiraceae bacterium]|nr:hypothetical protein [Lachnospiraceae bacterium]